MNIEIPRAVLEVAIATGSKDINKQLLTRLITIKPSPSTYEAYIYATDGKKMFRTVLNHPLQSIDRPISLFVENAEIALKQLKQTMGRNAKNIDTLVITFDPAKPYAVFLSIGNTTGKYEPSQAARELKVPVDISTKEETAETLEKMEKVFEYSVLNATPADASDKEKYCYFVPFLSYIVKSLDLLDIEFMNLSSIKICTGSCLVYSDKIPCTEHKVSISIMGAYV